MLQRPPSPLFRSFHRAAALVVLGATASAADLLVTSTADAGPGSLRDTVFAAAAGDTIRFDASLHGATITLTGGVIPIDRALTIEGPGASLLSIHSGIPRNLFQIADLVPVTISGLALRNGVDTSPGGGAIDSRGDLTIRGCLFEGNTGESGGAIYAFRKLVVSDSVFRSNLGLLQGGAICQPINGTDFVSLERCLFESNQGNGRGGAIRANDLRMTDCVLRQNTSFYSGGVECLQATLERCELSDNVGQDVGGMRVTNLSARSCTIAGNSSTLGDGGGLWIGSQGELWNCTISGNRVVNSGGGGGIFFHQGSLFLSSSTIQGNTARVGGALYNPSGAGALVVKNSIFVANAVPTLWGFNAGLTFSGVNMSSDFTALAFPYTSAQLALGPLADHGGPVRTHALLPGSVAIDAALDGTDWLGAPVLADARGVARPQGVAHDVGAFEYALDSDGDGLIDSVEAQLGTDPFDADTDDDGALDGDEVLLAGGGACPSPLAPDSDDDGLLDGDEILLGTMPCSGDTDGDGLPDALDPTPTMPGVPGSWLEARMRLDANRVLYLAPTWFQAPTPGGAVARRNATSNALTAAANAVALGNKLTAASELASLNLRLDGQPAPADWIIPSAVRNALRLEVQLLIDLVDLL